MLRNPRHLIHLRHDTLLRSSSFAVAWCKPTYSSSTVPVLRLSKDMSHMRKAFVVRGSRDENSGRLTPPDFSDAEPSPSRTWDQSFGIVFTDPIAEKQQDQRGSKIELGETRAEELDGVKLSSSTEAQTLSPEDSPVEMGIGNVADLDLLMPPSSNSKVTSTTESSPVRKRIRPGWGPYVPVHRKTRALSTGAQSCEHATGFTITETIKFNDAPFTASQHARTTSHSSRRSDKDCSNLRFTSDIKRPINTPIEQVGNTLEIALKGTSRTERPKIVDILSAVPAPTFTASVIGPPEQVPTPDIKIAVPGGVELPTNSQTEQEQTAHTSSPLAQPMVRDMVTSEFSMNSNVVSIKDELQSRSRWSREPLSPSTINFGTAESTYAQAAEEVTMSDGSSEGFFGGTQTAFDMDEIDAILEPESDSGPEEVTRKSKSKRKKQLEAEDHYLSNTSLSSELTTSSASEGEAGEIPTVSEEPYLPLSYQVPDKELARLKLLGEKHNGKVFWSHTWYEDQNGKKVEVIVCDTFDKCENAAKRFLGEAVLGFDLEWYIRPSKDAWRNVALIQLASENCIGLFQLARIRKDKVSELLAPSLRTILESKEILKVGVSIAGDGSRIKRWLDVTPQALLELSALHSVNENYKSKKRNARISLKPIALTTLCEMYLQFPISKGPVRTSDWTRPLSSEQVNYAATDAYAGLRIYDCLQSIRKNFHPPPPMPPCVNAQAQTNKQKRKGVIPPELALKLPGLDGPKQKAALLEQGDFQNTSRSVELISPALTPQEVPKPKRKPGARAQPLSPEAEVAMEWVRNYRLRNPDTGLSSSQLKAYALWHHGEHTVEEIIDFWPVKTSYIAKLVHQVVTSPSADMPYEEERYKKEITNLLRLSFGRG